MLLFAILLFSSLMFYVFWGSVKSSVDYPFLKCCQNSVDKYYEELY